MLRLITVGGLAVVLLSSCNKASDTLANAEALSKPTYKSIDGFRDLKFGSSFESAMASLDQRLFNSASVKDCFDDLPLKGCALFASTDYEGKNTDRAYEVRDGISYGLDLSFNRHDKLTDVTLAYRRAKRITGAQCLEIFGRTIDWVSADYGPLRADSAKQTGKNDRVGDRSPAGTAYSYLKPTKTGFVTDFVRLASEQVSKTIVDGQTRTRLLGRSVYLFASYIVVDEDPECNITVDFVEPDAVERRAYDAS